MLVEQLKDLVILTSLFWHSQGVSASHRMFTTEPVIGEDGEPVVDNKGRPVTRTARRSGAYTSASLKAKRRETGRLRKHWQKAIDEVAEDESKHLVLSGVMDKAILEYSKKISGKRVSYDFDKKLQERVEALDERGVDRLRVTGMGEFAGRCVAGIVLQAMKKVKEHAGRAPPVKNLRIAAEQCFLSEDLAEGNLEKLSKAELEHHIEREVINNMVGRIKAFIKIQRLGIELKELRPLLRKENYLIGESELVGVRQRHRAGRMKALRKMARKSGWREKHFSHPNADKVLNEIMDGAFRVEQDAFRPSLGKITERQRNKCRSAGKKYMRTQLAARRPE